MAVYSRTEFDVCCPQPEENSIIGYCCPKIFMIKLGCILGYNFFNRIIIVKTASVVSSQFPVTIAQTSVLHSSTHPAQPRPKPLLIKEQPLLLQELLEEEKQEQERAKLVNFASYVICYIFLN